MGSVDIELRDSVTSGECTGSVTVFLNHASCVHCYYARLIDTGQH